MRVVVALLLWLFEQSSLSVELRLPLAMVSRTNEIKKTDLEMSAGMGVNFWLWGMDRFSFGPSVGLYGSMPLQAGSELVRVARYRVVSEAGLTAALSIGEGFFVVRPFVDVHGQFGVLLIDKVVATQESLTPRVMYGAGARGGVSYWITTVGLQASYCLNDQNDGFAHWLELGMVLNI